ncbi:MAG: Zn-dependent alcohol dehydrogenase [Chloroflexi bacterium]|nr:Zn-dependent alcohol dehydrogenase [Chloroflexota bacterium]
MPRAAVMYAPNTPFQIVDVDVAPPRHGEALVKVAASGVCHSNLHFMHGAIPSPFPIIFGEEGIGVVEAVGPGVTTVAPGDHVIMLFRAHCGTCFYCVRGRPTLCDFGAPIRSSGRLVDGTSRFRHGDREVFHFAGVSSFSEYSVVPEQGLLKIRNDVPLDVAVLIACSVTSGAGPLLFGMPVEAGSSVLIIGAGGVGLNAVQGALLAAANPIVVADIVPAKLELAKRLGATHTIDARTEDVVAVTKSLTDGRGVDYALEVIGRTETMQTAFDATRKGGTMLIIGLCGPDVRWPISPLAMVTQEKTIRGTTYGAVNIRKDVPILLDLYLAGRLKLDELISRRFRLDEINEAFAMLERGEMARGVIIYE